MSHDKRCTKCGEVKPLKMFFNRSTARDGKTSACKVCDTRKMTAWQKKNRARVNALSVASYHRNKTRMDSDDWKAERRRLAAENAQTTRRKRLARHSEHERTDRVKAYRREYKNRPEVLARAKVRREERARDPKFKIAHALRQAQRRLRVGAERITPEEWSDILLEFSHRCAYCFVSTPKLVIEHVDPLARGGTHTIDNIVPACRSCNSRKHVKSLVMFLRARHVVDAHAVKAN